MLRHPSKASNPPAADWPRTTREAIAIQQQLRSRVIVEDDLGLLRRVAGLDVGFENRGAVARAAVAVLELPGLAMLDQTVIRQPTRFPYVPGLLSFREAPVLLAALAQLETRPDLLLCDGQGLAHPRRFGLACHLGVLTGLPSIGVAKSILVGAHDELPDIRGAWRPLWHRGEPVGAALRTRAGVGPVYVSIGHRVSLATAIGIVLACVTRYRLPETTRAAHRLASG